MTIKVKNLAEAEAHLSAFIPSQKAVRYSLDRMKQLMHFLGDPQNKLKVIHVAGTSGKTSTTYYIAALLHAAGYKVGHSVSPHIDVVSERAQINLEILPEDIYCTELSQFLELVSESGVEPSYFEVLVAFMFWLFNKYKVDYAVVEVGLGGLLDGTNVVERDDKIAVITDIGFDHMEILGNTLPEIAYQKAGIIHRHNQVFMHPQSDEVMNVFIERCKQQNADLHLVDDTESMTQIQQFDKLPRFQQRNFSLALGVVSPLISNPLTPNQLSDVTQTYIPARMEVVQWQGKTVIMDGSHNEQKLSALVEAVKQRYPGKNITLLVSFGQNKQNSLAKSLEVLRQISQTIIATGFSFGQDEPRRPIDPRIVAEYAHDVGFSSVTIEPDPQKALLMTINGDQDITIITGSFYLLNHIRPLVLENERP
jgi:dihydrofolate synthase/folylpolyglutamate synthase